MKERSSEESTAKDITDVVIIDIRGKGLETAIHFNGTVANSVASLTPRPPEVDRKFNLRHKRRVRKGSADYRKLRVNFLLPS